VTAIIPPRIVRGQTIGIVAPAGPVNLDRLRAGLERLGEAFVLRLAPSLTEARSPTTPSYLAASDEVRAAELTAMLRDPDVRAILLARGGYGLMRILPRLDPALLRADPKPIVGFSDATALLAWAHHAGVRGIHGPMGVQLASLPAANIAQLIGLLTEPRAPGPRPWTLIACGRGVHRGPLFAANLTLVSMLVGTPWALPLRGSIALVEEVGEKPYELDRYLTQLTLAGELSQPSAVIVGDLTRCADANPPTGVPDPEDAALMTVLERLHAAGTPAAYGAPIGHGDRNEPVPFGAAAVLDLERATLEITDAAVA
jgi:muramoyltetrapeptide carboxypeptidase